MEAKGFEAKVIACIQPASQPLLCLLQVNDPSHPSHGKQVSPAN